MKKLLMMIPLLMVGCSGHKEAKEAKSDEWVSYYDVNCHYRYDLYAYLCYYYEEETFKSICVALEDTYHVYDSYERVDYSNELMINGSASKLIFYHYEY